MREIPSQIPESLTVQTPDQITRISNMLAEELKQAGDASYKTPEEDKREYDYVRNKIDSRNKKGFLGLGRKRKPEITDIVDINDPDELWVITHTLYPKNQAEIAYQTVRKAQVMAVGGKIPEGEEWNAEKIHQTLISDPENYRLDLLNQRQLLFGQHAALPLLLKIMDEVTTPEEEGMVELEPFAKIDLFASKVRGTERSINQDSVGYVHPDTPEAAPFTEEKIRNLAKGTILAAADGVGGLRSGEIASNTAIEQVLYKFAQEDMVSPPEFLVNALNKANKAVYKPEQSERMGTTLVVAIIQGHELYIAHAGDSRVYLLRKGALNRLTTDHSERERTDPRAAQNFITEAIGVEPDLRDVRSDKVHGPYRLEKGDQILLCTDGLWGPLPDNTIAKILSKSKNPEDAVRELIKKAQNAGGTDDIGLAVAKIEELVKGKKVKIEPAPNQPTPGEPASIEETIPDERDLVGLAKPEETTIEPLTYPVPTEPETTNPATEFVPRRMIWKNAGSDIPVQVTGIAGTSGDGRIYYIVEGSNTALPADELIEEPENVRARVSDIVLRLRQLVAVTPKEETVTEQENRENEKIDLEAELSQVLNLAEDESIVTFVIENKHSNNLDSFRFPFERWNYSAEKPPSDQQIALLKRMFASAPQDLQESLSNYMKGIQEGQSSNEDESSTIDRIIKEADADRSFIPLQDKALNEYYNAAIEYISILRNPQSTQEEIIQAFKNGIKTTITYLKLNNLIEQHKKDYLEDLAQKAGLKINYGKNLSNNLLEEIIPDQSI